jgi:hypothetical protein
MNDDNDNDECDGILKIIQEEKELRLKDFFLPSRDTNGASQHHMIHHVVQQVVSERGEEVANGRSGGIVPAQKIRKNEDSSSKYSVVRFTTKRFAAKRIIPNHS